MALCVLLYVMCMCIHVQVCIHVSTRGIGSEIKCLLQSLSILMVSKGLSLNLELRSLLVWTGNPGSLRDISPCLGLPNAGIRVVSSPRGVLLG